MAAERRRKSLAARRAKLAPIVERLRGAVADGLAAELASQQLRALGLAPIEVILVMRELYGLRLGEAKTAFSKAPPDDADAVRAALRKLFDNTADD